MRESFALRLQYRQAHLMRPSDSGERHPDGDERQATAHRRIRPVIGKGTTGVVNASYYSRGGIHATGADHDGSGTTCDGRYGARSGLATGSGRAFHAVAATAPEPILPGKPRRLE